MGNRRGQGWESKNDSSLSHGRRKREGESGVNVNRKEAEKKNPCNSVFLRETDRKQAQGRLGNLYSDQSLQEEDQQATPENLENILLRAGGSMCASTLSPSRAELAPQPRLGCSILVQLKEIDFITSSHNLFSNRDSANL